MCSNTEILSTFPETIVFFLCVQYYIPTWDSSSGKIVYRFIGVAATGKICSKSTLVMLNLLEEIEYNDISPHQDTVEPKI